MKNHYVILHKNSPIAIVPDQNATSARMRFLDRIKDWIALPLVQNLSTVRVDIYAHNCLRDGFETLNSDIKKAILKDFEHRGCGHASKEVIKAVGWKEEVSA